MKESKLPNQDFTKKIIVKIDGLWKTFKTGDQSTVVLKDITTRINKGEFVMLFGPSGCGKSTLLNVLMGLEHPDKGNINLMDMDIWNLNSDERAVIRKNSIGIVYQQQNWISALNVLENIAFIGNLIGYSKEKSEKLAQEKLKLVGMSHRSFYRPTELSVGEQQRISLARALMSDPPLIVADEPTGNLDIKTGLKIMNIFKKLAKDGKTILMVTHNIGALNFADRVLLMIDGRLLRDFKIKKGSVDIVKNKILKDMETFIQDIEENQNKNSNNAPPVRKYDDRILLSKKNIIKNFLSSLWYNVTFTISMIFLLFFYIPSLLLERKIFKKSHFSSKIKNIIKNIFNRLQYTKKHVTDSISNWDLGEISLSHLIEKKSRTLITVLGMGLGIGFITFLLSIGYGLEKLVISEIAKLEQRRQITVAPVFGSEIILDNERYQLIKDVDGVSKIYPLVNIATTLYYKDSQTDIVAYGVEPSYLEASKFVFIQGKNFTTSGKEVVIGEKVLSMLGADAEEIIGENLSLLFIPIDQESLSNTVGENDNTLGLYDMKISYLVTGVIEDGSYGSIYFPIEQAKELGVDDYSELLVEIGNEREVINVRKDIEALGMKTNSIMDTVSEVERIFGYVKLSLTVVGIVAYIIAILGMVNTLIVSLMERTREVGLLKAVGMQSTEVKKLFVTEAMFISFVGGIAGILFGLLGGFFLSFIFSVLSLLKGGSYLIVSRIPVVLVLLIVFCSVVIGYITGLYPSKRAVKMSPLDALRYE